MSSFPGLYSEKRIDYCIVKDGVRVICDGAFAGCDRMTEVSLPSSLNIIGAEAFSGCSKLNEIIIPNSVVYIGFKAFDCDGRLFGEKRNSPLRISIPDSVEVIDGNPFGFNVTIHNNNKRFRVVDNVLYSADGTRLISYCSQDETFIVPNGVKVIGAGAFMGANITTITLPDTLEVIEKNAFHGCHKLKEIAFPESLKRIEDKAFDLCNFNNRVISLPSSIETIAANAFDLCFGVLCVIVPVGRVEYYKTVFPDWFSEQICDKGVTYENGFYISSDGRELIASDSTDNIYIPDGVETVRDHSLRTEYTIKTIRIPASLENISRNAFRKNVEIKRMLVPTGKKDYYRTLFKGMCKSIKEW